MTTPTLDDLVPCAVTYRDMLDRLAPKAAGKLKLIKMLRDELTPEGRPAPNCPIGLKEAKEMVEAWSAEACYSLSDLDKGTAYWLLVADRAKWNQPPLGSDSNGE